MQRALELFEAGKVSEANVVLEDAEREADASLAEFRQAKQLLAAKMENIVRSIDELLLKASVTLADTAIQREQRIEQAHSLYKKAIELSCECEIDKKKYSKILKGYCDFLRQYAKYSELMPVALQRLALDKEVFGELSAEVGACYSCIGIAYYSRHGEYTKALDYFNKSLEIRIAVFGESHPDVASCYNNIGAVYCSQGEYAKALEYYDKSLAIRLTVLGESHHEVANSYNNLGVVYDELGEYAKALDFYNKSLKIDLAKLGESHPDIAGSYNNIAVVYNSQGDYSKALDYYEKSLLIY
jgi:tetratricopeptide (TPR) repeat protein